MRLCLREGWTSLDQMLEAFKPRYTIGPGRIVEGAEADYLRKGTSDWQNQPYGWDTVVPFGKHQGETLGVIARTDPDYIRWLHEEGVRSTQLRRALSSVNEWLEENPQDEA